VAGGLVPDIPTYAFFFVHTILLGTSQQLMWDVLYFDSAWSPLITLSHSLLLWPLLLLVATITKQRLLQWFSLSALLHASLDFFVHHDDAYRHFWPLTDWRFFSPLSYYDPLYYGSWVNSVDSIIVIALLAWLGSIYNSKWAKIGIGTLIVLYVFVYIIGWFFRV